MPPHVMAAVLLGAALHASWNLLVKGGTDTVQTYLWSQYQQVGLSPNMFALMTVLIAGTLVLLAVLALVDRARAG